MDARHPDRGLAKFCPERFGKPANGELARAIAALPGHADEAEHARHIHDVRLIRLSEHGEKSIASGATHTCQMLRSAYRAESDAAIEVRQRKYLNSEYSGVWLGAVTISC